MFRYPLSGFRLTGGGVIRLTFPQASGQSALYGRTTEEAVGVELSQSVMHAGDAV